jgi:hypothetical protein
MRRRPVHGRQGEIAQSCYESSRRADERRDQERKQCDAGGVRERERDAARSDRLVEKPLQRRVDVEDARRVPEMEIDVRTLAVGHALDL